MDFQKVRVPYEGRREFGTEGSDGVSLAHSIISQYFGGIGGAGGTETGGNGNGYGGDENRGGNAKSFNAWLSKNSRTFNELELAGAPNGITDVVTVMGYRDMEPAQTLIGDINNSASTIMVSGDTSADTYDIQGLVEGISVVVSGNGTNGTILYITADQRLQSGGTLTIPVAVNINDNPLDPYQYVWWQNPNKVKLIYLTYTWALDKGGSSNYFMDLSNERAQINCDSAGTMLSASIMTVTCTATTTMNGDPVAGIRYSAATDNQYNARGYHINSGTGEIWFTYSGSGAYFAFDGSSLPINVYSELQENGTWVRKPAGSKTMTIYKNYPGADGSPAVSHWINTSVNQVKYDSNEDTLTPSAVTAYVWRQVGYNTPELDGEYSGSMYYWFASSEPNYIPSSPNYTAGTPINLTSHKDEAYVAFGLKNPSDEFFEIETVPILPTGKDGESGATGPQGPAGASGESSWHLTLDNDNCSINADSEGEIIKTAYHPSCTAKVYYGSKRMATGFTWDIDAPDIGDNMIRENWNTPSAGCITFETTSALTFSAESIQLSVGIKVSGETVDTKFWNITKSIAGESGQSSVSYWLQPSFTEIIYNPNIGIENPVIPSVITCSAYTQEGGGPVTTASTANIAYKLQRRGYTTFTPSATSGTPFPSTGLSFNAYSAETYQRLRLILYVGQSQFDMEDIDILMDGLSGATGPQGPAGASGRKGAVIRGPYDYYSVSASQQCWCAGQAGYCEECENWIDIVYKDGVYYRCKQSYYGTCASASTNSSGLNRTAFWASGETYDFVATQVLLASAASINFLSNNELYLRDENGNITGGARGGSGTTFWAGGDPNELSDDEIPFRVDVSGNVYAQKGIFAGYIQYPYTLVAQLEHETTGSGAANIKSIYYADGRAYLVSNEDTIGSTSYHNEAAHLVLPEPTSGWNGFTYDIIVEPSLSRMDGNQQLVIHASGETDIYCYAFAELRIATYYELTGGRYQITCMPKKMENTYGYRWAITLATGGINVYKNYGESNQSEEFISTLLGTSWDTPSLVNKIVTYTGSTKPTVPSTGNTMYVKL